jgi:hypothetical protein
MIQTNIEDEEVGDILEGVQEQNTEEEKVEETAKEKRETIETKPEKKKTKEEIKLEKIHIAKEKEEEVDRYLKEAKIDNLNSSCYMEMDNYVGMVKTGAAYGCVIEGPGGIGKTWRIIKLLKDIEYAYTDSFTTPQALYCWLYANRNKEVIIVDDVYSFLDSPKVLAFLKGGLWHVGDSKNRIIHYMTTKPMQDENGNYVPNAFILSARMIIITNKLNRKNPHLNAILTRINSCKVEIDYEEMINILEQVSQKEYPGLNLDERLEILKFIQDNTSESNDDLNIRTLIKCFQQKVYSKRINKPDLWRQLAMMSILQKNPALIIVEELVNDPSYENEDERIAEFKKKSGRSRATYYRLKENMKLSGDKLKPAIEVK